MGYLVGAIGNFWSFVLEFGVRAPFQIFQNNRTGDGIKNLSIRGYKQPFYYRQGTTDFPILRFIIGREYVFKEMNDPQFIIDAGANVGYVSVFYANRFPKAAVVAIEMESSNVEMLKRNTVAYPNVIPIHAALWNHNKGVSFDADANKDAYTLIGEDALDKNYVASITLKEVLEKNRGKICDLIKLDIEGAEIEILDYMRSENIQPEVLVVELHDRFREGCRHALERYLDGRTYKRQKIYEYEVVDFLNSED